MFSLRMERLHVKMLDILVSHVTAALHVSQLGSLCSDSNFEHVHEWPFKCRPRGPPSFYLKSIVSAEFRVYEG